MASNIDCKRNEATCSKKQPYVQNTFTQSITHILILLLSTSQGP